MNFQAGEKCLCYHGPLIYQAKILKAEIWTGQDPSEGGFTGPHYQVHYQGWKATWDEWVPESRVLKLNEENINRQKSLVLAAQNKAREEDAKKAGASSSAASASAAGGRDGGKADSSRKRQRDSDEKGRSGRASTSGAGSSSNAAGLTGTGAGSAADRKRSRDAVGDEDDFLRKPEIKISIPEALKVQLVDDWENVTKLEKLVALPRKPNVKEVLKLYRDWVVERKKEKEKSSSGLGGGAGTASSRALSQPISVLDEVLSGLEVYFDKSLGNNLLYRFERMQYLQVKKGAIGGSAEGLADIAAEKAADKKSAKGKREVSGDGLTEETPPSEVYGAEHLLRLFVNLPGIIAHTTLDAESVGILRDQLDEFLAFMVKEKSKLFGRYEVPSPSYHRMSAI